MAANIIPVILCGGSGRRLQPLSRPDYPKQFLRLLSDQSFLQETALRAVRVSGAASSDVVTVTLDHLKPHVMMQYREIDWSLEDRVICEPEGKNTAAAIALAALYVHRRFRPDSIMWIMPSDHHISDEAVLKQDLQKAVGAARENHLVTFGIKPTRGDTGYGYIRTGGMMPGASVHYVDQFVEKPDAKTAAFYWRSGQYLWNSGMFVFTAENILDAYEQYAPDLLTAVRQGDYAPIHPVPFDKAIMEKSRNVAVVPSNPGWSDIGTWEALWDIGVRQTRKRA